MNVLHKTIKKVIIGKLFPVFLDIRTIYRIIFFAIKKQNIATNHNANSFEYQLLDSGIIKI